MPDFGIQSTQLSDPRGQGTSPVAPVQEHASRLGPSPVFGAIADIFAKGLQDNAKEEAAKRKNAIVGEYLNNEKIYSDALVAGSWNSGRVATSSRANFTKFIAAYPEYVQDLTQARASVYGGTEIGEAEKRVDAEQKLREADKQAASNMGYTFYPGMGEDAQNKTIDAYKAARRVEQEFSQNTARAAEDRAQRADARAGQTFDMTVDEHVAKARAVDGTREIASKNFDVLDASGSDLVKQIAAGMPPEQALALHNSNINRIKAALLAVAGRNPEMASPWVKLFDDMDANIKSRLDPKTKTADERKMLEDQYAILVTKGKLAAVTRPEILDAVIKTNLFPGETMVQLAVTPAIQEWTLNASNPAKSGNLPQAVGKQGDDKIFATTKAAINRLQSGQIPASDQGKATVEAANLVNTLLKQTASVEGSLNPAALKSASTFFASTEFGKMAMEGKVDKQTAANAQHVFQVQYEPAVRKAIIDKLDSEVYNGEPLSKSIDIKTVGGNVIFNYKATKRPEIQGIDSFIGAGMRGNDIKAGTAALKDAENGLNQLIRMHAHLEGTTDYAKYWEDNKHRLLPSVFPDPAKLKPGQTENGFKYIGGNYRDPSNWIAVPSAK